MALHVENAFTKWGFIGTGGFIPSYFHLHLDDLRDRSRSCACFQTANFFSLYYLLLGFLRFTHHLSLCVTTIQASRYIPISEEKNSGVVHFVLFFLYFPGDYW